MKKYRYRVIARTDMENPENAQPRSTHIRLRPADQSLPIHLTPLYVVWDSVDNTFWDPSGMRWIYPKSHPYHKLSGGLPSGDKED